MSVEQCIRCATNYRNKLLDVIKYKININECKANNIV